MKKHLPGLVFIVLFFSSPVPTFSQTTITLNGIVAGLEDSAPISYASIGFIDKPIGVISDSTGHFSLTLDKNNQNDSLHFSCIGYLPEMFSVQDLAKEKNPFVIRLKRSEAVLQEVMVTNRRLNTEIIGRQSSGNFFQFAVNPKSSFSNNLGPEFGMKVTPKHFPVYLKELHFNFCQNRCERVKFRVNVYHLKNNFPDSLISAGDIFATIPDYKTGWNQIDLEPFHLMANADFAICIQWVEYTPNAKGEANLNVPGAFSLSGTSYYRLASQDKWKKGGVNLSFYVTVLE